jgi:hypothetical protein
MFVEIKENNKDDGNGYKEFEIIPCIIYVFFLHEINNIRSYEGNTIGL